jgi:UDP-glucose 4-epimerase
MAVGEKGEGDEFGLGNETAYTMLDVAKLFGSTVEMLPERAGNRQSSDLDTTKSRTLGWSAKVSLEDEIAKFLQKHTPHEK